MPTFCNCKLIEEMANLYTKKVENQGKMHKLQLWNFSGNF
jgi:hypothetical protein